MTPTRAWWILALSPQIGCALFLKSDPFVPRYFSPETATTSASPIAPSGLELRLGRVNAADYLRDRIVFRDSAYEVGYYEERRWTETPESYVRRELGRALFDRRGVRQIMYGAGSTLDVDVIAFEEVRGPAHVGRVELTYVVVGDRTVQFAHSITVERPIANTTASAAADSIVQALGRALVDAVEIVAEGTCKELRVEAATGLPSAAAATR
jgi:cholesterol transport system auxiliary component